MPHGFVVCKIDHVAYILAAPVVAVLKYYGFSLFFFQA
jgi:hypothetical protein